MGSADDLPDVSTFELWEWDCCHPALPVILREQPVPPVILRERSDSQDPATTRRMTVDTGCLGSTIAASTPITTVRKVDGMSFSTAIVGPGAIGTTIAAALHESGNTPVLCGHRHRDHLTLLDGTRIITVPGPILTDPAEQADTADVVFLAVKATQTEAAAGWLTSLCGPHTVVCVLQNGIEQVRMVTPYAAGSQVIPAVVWFPAQAQPDGSILLRGHAQLTLPDTQASKVIQAVLDNTWCEAELSADFSSLAWRKLLQNAAGGLMVLTGRRSGTYRRADISRLTLDYLDECLQVARAEGASLDDGTPQEILNIYQSSPPDMGNSILADHEAGRPLEWDIRNGVIQRLGRVHGIPTPISDVIVPLLAAASDAN